MFVFAPTFPLYFRFIVHYTKDIQFLRRLKEGAEFHDFPLVALSVFYKYRWTVVRVFRGM